jgi:hypothetical protein
MITSEVIFQKLVFPGVSETLSESTGPYNDIQGE